MLVLSVAEREIRPMAALRCGAPAALGIVVCPWLPAGPEFSKKIHHSRSG